MFNYKTNYKKRTFTGDLKISDHFESNSNQIDYESSKKRLPSLSQSQKSRLRVSTTSHFSVELSSTNDSSDEIENKLLISDSKNGFLSKFFSGLKHYLQTTPYDVAISLENGKRLNAHRIMLENSSCFFRRKLEQCKLDISKNKVYLIHLNEINDFKMLKVCVDYIYSGGRELNVEAEKLYDLQVTAEKLELNELSKLCERIIENMKASQKEYFQNFINSNESFAQLASMTELNIPFSKLIQNMQLAQLSFENKYNEMIQQNESNKLKQNGNNSIGIQTEELKRFGKASNPFLSSNLFKTFTSSSCSPSSSSASFSSSSSTSSLSPSSTWSMSASPILDEKDLRSNQKSTLFEDSIISTKIKEYLNEKTTLTNSAFSPVNSFSIEIDTMSSQFSILNKYIYPSMINSDTKLIKNYLENFLFVNNSIADGQESNSEFKRDSLIVFCVQFNEQKINNLLLRAKLNFADFNDLKNDIKRNLEILIVKIFQSNLLKDLRIVSLNSIINRLFYLKKPANCKTIRLDQIKSSTDCFRAIVEYSRFNESNEKPIVFTTVNASVSIKFSKC